MAILHHNRAAAALLVLSSLSRHVSAFVVCTGRPSQAFQVQQTDILSLCLSTTSTGDEVVSSKDLVSEDSDKAKPVVAAAPTSGEVAEESVVDSTTDVESGPVSKDDEPVVDSLADEITGEGSSSEEESELIPKEDEAIVDAAGDDEIAIEDSSDESEAIVNEDGEVVRDADNEFEPAADQEGSSDLESVSEEEAINYSNKITHLQKKLRYWKKQQKEKEIAYKRYLQQQMIEGKTKPIYVREGKVDHYKLRPIFNQETERIQTEVWSIKENIKLTQTKLEAARHVEDMQRETDERLAQAEIEKQLHAEEMRRETEERLAQAKLAQARHAEEVRLLEEKAKSLQEESTERLTQKEEEIDSLAEKIDHLSETLQAKRSELENKETSLQSLEDELQTKESVLNTLERERASLRSLVRQSWSVLKGRLRRRILGGDGGGETSETEQIATDDIATTTDETDSKVNGDSEGAKGKTKELMVEANSS